MLDRPNGQIPDDAEIRALRRHSSQVRQQLEQGVDALKSQRTKLSIGSIMCETPFDRNCDCFCRRLLNRSQAAKIGCAAVKPGVVSAASEVIPMPECRYRLLHCKSR